MTILVEHFYTVQNSKGDFIIKEPDYMTYLMHSNAIMGHKLNYYPISSYLKPFASLLPNQSISAPINDIDAKFIIEATIEMVAHIINSHFEVAQPALVIDGLFFFSSFCQFSLNALSRGRKKRKKFSKIERILFHFAKIEKN